MIQFFVILDRSTTLTVRNGLSVIEDLVENLMFEIPAFAGMTEKKAGMTMSVKK